MATKISTEILTIILRNVQSSRLTQDLYPSLLVNRIWCKVTIPLLWELTFGKKCYKDDKRKLKKKALCIRTYISCMDTQARTLLTQNGFNLSSSPPQAIFDYPSFTHKFIIKNLVYFISIYSQQIIDRCTFLEYFKLHEKFSKKNRNYGDLITTILDLPGAPKVFKKLESFTAIIRNNEQIRPLYESLALILKFINVQKRLENITIYASNLDCNSLLWAIISQKETLKSLYLMSANFSHFKEKSSPIGQFTSLQKLYIENCDGLDNSDCLFLASSFTQLNSFHYFHTRNQFNGYAQEFIIKILETASTNLRNICLVLHRKITFGKFSTIMNYCTKIVELALYNLNPEQVIAIFNNNFNELRKFSFGCGGDGFDANELLCKMAENIPKSLETIKIIMFYENQWIFSADSLRKFFEGWHHKGGRNKRIIVKRPKKARLFTLSDENIKVIEEYGVQFDIE
ncbi:11414_t:CDS:2 [Diversispora eburnea]|uniref:11414_t:CDS:1 n=1 Tax=Diversispora eburnea TaxID=1213867 RepID=A0A9N8VMD5_9GLOM|nr:11414_t:CDS:2 [Diversispora eburnea]